MTILVDADSALERAERIVRRRRAALERAQKITAALAFRTRCNPQDIAWAAHAHAQMTDGFLTMNDLSVERRIQWLTDMAKVRDDMVIAGAYHSLMVRSAND